MSPLHIASLGSSFAAGPNIPPRINRPAARSGANYAHLLASALNARLTDLSVSGATLKNVLDEPQTSVLTRTSFPPQVEGLSDDVDIVTITAGGNDLGYVGGIMGDSLRATWIGRVIQWLFFPAGKDEGNKLEAEDIKDRFISIIDDIKRRSPKARIYLVEYLTLFGENTRPGIDVLLDEEQIKRHQEVARTLQSAYRVAADARRDICRVVRVGERSWEHGLGSEDPWVEVFGWGVLFRRKAPYHPNANGMRAVAEIILEELKGDGALNTSAE